MVEERKGESKEDVRHFHIMGESTSPCKQYPRPLPLVCPKIIVIIMVMMMMMIMMMMIIIIIIIIIIIE